LQAGTFVSKFRRGGNGRNWLKLYLREHSSNSGLG